MANPDQSMKPLGTWEVRRNLVIPALTTPTAARSAERVVNALPGVCMALADSNKQRLSIRYDASRIDYQTIASALGEIQLQPASNWWNRIKSDWYQFSDNNARSNAKAPPPPCCSKPPSR